MYRQLWSETSATIVEQGNYIAEVAEVLESSAQASATVSTKLLKRLFYDLDGQNETILKAVYGGEELNSGVITHLFEQITDLLSDTTSDMNDIENLLKKHGSPYTISIVKTLEEVRQALNKQHMALLQKLLKNTKLLNNTKSEVSR